MSNILTPGFLKWDGSKWIVVPVNQVGPVGPTGPAGPAGPTGPAGATGSGGGGYQFSYVNFAASPFTPTLSTSYIRVLNVDTTSGAVTINLPSSPQDGYAVVVKDGYGTSELHNITISTTDNIDGYSTATIGLANASLWLVFDAHWRVI